MMKYILAFLFLVQPQSGPLPTFGISQSQTASCRPSELNEYEAEILPYLLPASAAVRNDGNKVGWEMASSSKLNQKDFFIFYVYDVKAPNYSSPTVGYFGINKHTAEVWDMDSEEFVQSKDLLAVEEILRRGHCVDERILKTYSSRRPDIPTK